jgi:hypothetical protein
MILGIMALALIGCGMTPEQEAAKAEEVHKGFHCLSAWDGNHDGLEGLVRPQLNDPGSMETHETRIWPVGDGNRHRIIMTFGAGNAFGGMVRHTAIGWIDHDSCEATLVSVD